MPYSQGSFVCLQLWVRGEGGARREKGGGGQIAPKMCVPLVQYRLISGQASSGQLLPPRTLLHVGDQSGLVYHVVVPASWMKKTPECWVMGVKATTWKKPGPGYIIWRKATWRPETSIVDNQGTVCDNPLNLGVYLLQQPILLQLAQNQRRCCIQRA